MAATAVTPLAVPHLEPDRLFLEVTKEITGEPVRLIRDDGGSDARFIAACGIPVLMSRPLVGNLHGKDEWIDIDSMLTFYRIYQAYVRRTLGYREAAGEA